ncbi:MAG: peptide-binding protein [Thermodesulfobacteriota bacterium]
MRNRYFSVGFFIMWALAVAGCSGQSNGPGTNTAAPEPPEYAVPAYGDMFVDGSIGDASVLLPVLAADSASFAVTGNVYNGLVKYDEDINLVGDLAEKWEISPDNLKIRFYLNKGVRWQDGQPFTARDVEYTYLLYTDEKTPTAYATDFLKVKEFRVLDDYTVEVTYDKPYAPALGSWAVAIHPRHLLAGTNVVDSPLKRHPVGTGPYKFKEWVTGEKILLDANPDCFMGRPYISRTMTRIIPDPATMFLELKAGRIDMMGLGPLQYMRQTNTSWFKEQYKKYKYLATGYTYLGYNLQKEKFKDKRVRQAITMAIDREGIVKGVLLGLGVVAHSPYKPDTYWYNPNVRKFPYDPEKAKQLLAEAGWKDTDNDGILDKDGTPFEIEIITNHGNETRKNTATIIQWYLGKIGIKVKIRVIEWAAFLKNFINKRNFEVCLLGWSIGQDPHQVDIWNSKKTGPTQLNFVHYQNPEVDELLDKGAATYDRAERKKYYDKFQEIIAEDQPYTFLYVPESLPIVSSRIKGIVPAPLGISYDFPKWYVPKPMQKYQIEP